VYSPYLLSRSPCFSSPRLSAQTTQIAPDRTAPGRITAVGVGESTRAPDVATITVGVISEAETAREALSRNTAAMTAARESLRAAGIEPRDLQTAGFNLSPRFSRYRPGSTPPRIVGYQVTNMLTVRVRDLAKVSDVMDRAVSLGANNVTGPVFGLSDPASAREEARRAAVADALARARLDAEGLGVRVGRIVSVNEGAVSQPRPQPMAAARTMAAESVSVPIEAGETSLSAQVTVVFEIVQ
jgi:uncharacterized protein YggE